MENLISNLSNCFSDTEKPILIFCNWNDALAIQENLLGAIENMSYAEFKNKNKLFHFNCFSCSINGKELFFIDQNQTQLFFEFISNKS